MVKQGDIFTYKKTIQSGSVVLVLQINGTDSVCPLSDEGEPCVNNCVHHKTIINKEENTLSANLGCFDKKTVIDIQNTIKLNYVPIKGIVAC